jgi:hypothetical protein
MNRLLLLLGKELSFWFRRVGVHAFFGLFALLGVLFMLAMAGDIEFIRIGGMGGLRKADSPYQLTSISLALSVFVTLNIGAASGGAATRDVTDGMHPLVFTTPVPKVVFLLSRYLGALAVSSYLVCAFPLGLLVGRLLTPFLEAERIGAFSLLPTVFSMLVWIGPNVLLLSALFFGIGAVTRKMFPVYIGGVFVLVGYLGASSFLADLDDRTIGILLDVFGITALDELTRYWTAEDTNTLLPIPTGAALVSRLMWTGLGLGALVASVALTRLDQFGWQPFARFRGANEPVEAEQFDASRPVPQVGRDFGTGSRLVQLRALTFRAVRDVVTHRYFWAFVGATLLFELLNTQAIGSLYGTDTWPVTYAVLEVLVGSMGLFLIVITTFYAGDLVWTERDSGAAQLIDSAPLPDWLPLIAKFVALTVVILGLHTTALFVGPAVQLFYGYTAFEVPLYLQVLYGVSLLEWVPIIALSLAIHAVANNKLVGHAALIGFWMLNIFRTSLGFEHNLFWIGADPGRMYSDMNAWGFAAGPYLLYKAYWFAWSIVFLAVARLFWVRGTGGTFRSRLSEAKRRLDRPTRGVLGTGAVLAGAFAAFIAVQTNVVHGYETSVDSNRERAAYERAYKETWEGAPHPLVTAVDSTVDLYPSEGRAAVKATLSLVNPHDTSLESLLVTFPEEKHVVSVDLSIPYEETLDERFEIRRWELKEPMRPGQTATLTFEVDYQRQGIANSGFETVVVENGTFLHHYEVFPAFGYARDAELSDPATRRKYDLPERDRMYDLDDPRARQHNYLTDDAHRVTARTRLSTVEGQIPLGVGDQIDQGTANGRTWAVFETDEPIWYFLSWLSADWEVATSTDGPIPTAVYYHPSHTYNIDRMLEATNRSLAIFERDFGPYQHEILRIVEFPRYATFAQSFPTLVPFSEGIGFIAKITDPDEDIDYPFYVTAHEVAHQWWAHQVCGGNGQGATVLTESMSQYGALKVMEAEYGKDQIDRFLEYEADRYFRGRQNERDEELPLMRVENQQYIHYQKGGIVLYTLSERVGRERFDRAIQTFLEEWRFVGPPYPTARDFVDHLKAELPEHVEAIEDGFERIVLYDLRAAEATAKKRGQDWVIAVDVTARKLQSDGEGRETEVDFADDVMVAVEDASGETHRQTVRIAGSGVIEVVFSGLASAPESIELDPRALFLERDRDDNQADVTVDSGA